MQPTHEQQKNLILGKCNYHLLSEKGSTKFWERTCEKNQIDFVIGINWTKTTTPEAKDFNIKKGPNVALRFIEKHDAEVYYNKRS